MEFPLNHIESHFFQLIFRLQKLLIVRYEYMIFLGHKNATEYQNTFKIHTTALM
jgi:hypothetical protein